MLKHNEFLCLLFIYCGHIDYSFSLEEKQVCIRRFGQTIYDAQFQFYNNNKESEIFRILLEHLAKYYPKEIDAIRLKKELTIIFKADGKICGFEKSFLHFIELYLSKL